VLTVFRLLMWVSETYVFVRFRRYFHPGEAKVKTVSTRVWFQDDLSESLGVCPNVCFIHFLLGRRVNIRKGIEMMYVGCLNDRAGPVTVDSDKS
jgi:hypothetical protein